MAYEFVQKGKTSHDYSKKVNYVLLSKSSVYFSYKAQKLMNLPKYLKIGIDDDDMRIGFIPTLSNFDSYNLTYSARSKVTASISSISLLNQLKAKDFDVADLLGYYELEIDGEGIPYIDLTKKLEHK